MFYKFEILSMLDNFHYVKFNIFMLFLTFCILIHNI